MYIYIPRRRGKTNYIYIHTHIYIYIYRVDTGVSAPRVNPSCTRSKPQHTIWTGTEIPEVSVTHTPCIIYDIHIYMMERESE